MPDALFIILTYTRVIPSFSLSSGGSACLCSANLSSSKFFQRNANRRNYKLRKVAVSALQRRFHLINNRLWESDGFIHRGRHLWNFKSAAHGASIPLPAYESQHFRKTS